MKNLINMICILYVLLFGRGDESQRFISDCDAARILGIDINEYNKIAKEIGRDCYCQKASGVYFNTLESVKKMIEWFETVGTSYIIAKELGGKNYE